MAEDNENKPIVCFENVFLSFGDKAILKNLSFKVNPKEIVCIVGPSGSGKSTILKLISKLISPDSGKITVKAKRIGMAFQYPALFNSMTIWENVALALEETTDLSFEEIDKKVMKSLKIVKLEHTKDQYPQELSGGMQKRISVARALAIEPEILLYDEPSTGLDPATAAQLESYMVKLRKEISVTSIVVTHDVDTIDNVSDRVLILDDGHIVWEGSITKFQNDHSPYPCSFRERLSIEECENLYKNKS